MEPFRPVVEDSHHLNEKQDPDPHLSDAYPQPGSEHTLIQSSDSGSACSFADPHRSGKLDPDPHQSWNQDTDPHQNEKLEALEGNFGAFGGSKYGKW
jgi:hypothetical protein